MEEEGGERKKSVLARAVERCRRLPSLGNKQRSRAGCFTVLVGPEKERFAVPARCAGHPLFRALLDEAEAEHGGFPACRGPLELPCAVDAFMDVMWEMEQAQQLAEDRPAASPGCGRLFTASSCRGRDYGGYQMMSPARFLVAGVRL